MLFARFAGKVFQSGSLTIIDADGRQYVLGGADGPTATIRLHDKRLHYRLAINPYLCLGEAYMDGALTVEQGTLYDFMSICALNIDRAFEQPLKRALTAAARVLQHLHQYNPPRRAKANVAHHYDLSDRLYDLFLDSDRQYSCGYFGSDHHDIERAQHDKKRHLAAKLLLEPGQRILDIGSGWGGMALYLAEVGSCDVLGITLSEEQFKASRLRAERAGMADRVRFELRDYRELTGRFDRIVSIGMFEHVGVNHYPEFFAQIGSLLHDDGIAVLHSIGRMTGPSETNEWMRKYIFPGGYMPALSEVLPVAEQLRLWVTDIEVLRLHYAETLRCWHERFVANRTEIVGLYDERFCRMWEFYLVGSELAFRSMGHMVFQMQIAKRQGVVPLTRDYITDWERGRHDAKMAAD